MWQIRVKAKRLQLREFGIGKSGIFWDINWVVGEENENDDNGKWLDQRKNWRSHLQADEPGDLCRLMGRYQELSGYHRISNKAEQKDFWAELAKQKYTHSSTNQIATNKERGLRELNIKEDECLCAIAVIKRLFPIFAKELIRWQPGGTDVNIINWPSVSYIAAVPWLKSG